MDNENQWRLASWALFPKPLDKKRQQRAIVEQYAKWITPGDGFQSLGDFNRRIGLIPSKWNEWRNSYVCPGPQAESWQPTMIEFWLRNSLDVLEGIVSDIRMASHMKWAPEKLYNSKGDRLYSELWTGD